MAKKVVDPEIPQDIKAQVERLKEGGYCFDKEGMSKYIAAPDNLGAFSESKGIPIGYKKCGKCQEVKKFFLFNRNTGTKTCTTGNCKDCQKSSAGKSYTKTKKSRNYKKYYQENKELKQEHARKYYAENKDKINAMHKDYLTTNKGKKVMKKAHDKRAQALATNKGIPWKRDWILDRDCMNGEFPICYLCGEPITDDSGKACHMDHVISVGNGGLDCFTNVAAVHQSCNLTKEKDDRNLQTSQVEAIVALAEAYIDAHPELFTEEEDSK